ncbi:hypothetical protein [Mannheimia pernigra]|uniref:Uncharacterized protein n=1 Tax=Mannheimia pernigra TaxID=111844 RepID=A0A7D5DX19_9PAST|nr:hypothetical protein [Mannheimia pernigra]QLB40299.1 hypothetical protein HV559_05170 [Mannheimia pernigra]
MEWQGIDLSDNKKRKWVQIAYSSIKNITYIVLFTGIISLYLIFYGSNQNTNINILTQQLEQKKNEVLEFKNKILLLQSGENNSLSFAENNKLAKLLTLINKLPLKRGGIEVIQIHQENELHLKMSGNLSEEDDFKKLEQYLYNQDFVETKTESVSVNHKNEITFVFNIKYKAN